MRDEVKRILKLLEDGVLDGDQANEMIGLLADDAERRSEHTEHRRRDRPGFERRFEDLGADIGQAVEKAVGSVLGMLGGAASEDWLDDSNEATFAKTEPPAGDHYEMRDNRVVVSRLAALRLNNAAFCANEMHASAVTGLDCNYASFNENTLRGSSFKRTTVERGAVAGNRIDGSQLGGLRLRDSSLVENAFKGAQVRELEMTDAEMHKCSVNGTKLRNVTLGNGTRLADTKLSGIVGNDWLFDDSHWAHVRLKGTVVKGLTAKRANLEHCSFRHGERISAEAAGDTASVHVQADIATMRDLTLSRVTMRHCEFINCQFDGTVIENIELAEHLRFENVDFAERTIATLDELKALATDAC